MVAAILVFLLGAGGVMAAYAAITRLPAALARRHVEQRLQDVTAEPDAASDGAASIVRAAAEGPLPELDRLVARSPGGSRLTRLIAQSGCRTTPGAVVVMSLVGAISIAFIARAFTQPWFVALVAAGAAAFVPTGFLMNRRTARFKAFEEMFPEALDLVSRALRAGHAFQTALGMVGEELKQPVGPEFKQTFDHQNFGLPLRDALNQLAERMPSVDVRFFVTAVLIQRETGGNLAEVLDNLAHVVRERFKIQRQVRVHTAHGRFTAFVLLSLPPALAVGLSMINHEHMDLLFHEHAGQTMLMAGIVMQTIGFLWIRRVIRIEV